MKDKVEIKPQTEKHEAERKLIFELKFIKSFPRVINKQIKVVSFFLKPFDILAIWLSRAQSDWLT